MADLEQGEPKQDVVTTPCAGSSSIPTKEESSSASKNLFGGGDTGFGFNFDDTCDNSFSFFGNGGCKSPEQGEKDGQFFLNFGDGDGDKMEEDSGWNFFGQWNFFSFQFRMKKIYFCVPSRLARFTCIGYLLELQ